MKTFEVWYMKPSFFRDGILGTKWLHDYGMMPTAETLTETHVHLFDIDAETVNHAWQAQQAENWSPTGQAAGLLREKGLSHTSMSVGDILVDKKTGGVLICDSIGWVTLT